MTYKARFNGGPLHGEERDSVHRTDIFLYAKVYDSGLTTQSRYLLKKEEDGVLFYDIIEEKFVSFSSHLERYKR